MSRKNTLNNFQNSYYNHAYVKGYGVAEGLADLARHRKPEDLGYAIFVIGVVFCVALYVCIAYVLLLGRTEFQVLFPLVALAGFGTFFSFVGWLMLPHNRKKRKK